MRSRRRHDPISFPGSPLRLENDRRSSRTRLTSRDTSSKSARRAKDFESGETVSIAESAPCLLVRCLAQLVNREPTSLHVITAWQARIMRGPDAGTARTSVWFSVRSPGLSKPEQNQSRQNQVRNYALSHGSLRIEFAQPRHARRSAVSALRRRDARVQYLIAYRHLPAR